MSTDTGTSLRVTRMVKTDPEAAFRAWTEPRQMKQWMCPEDATVEDVEVDLTVGGRYRIRMRGAQGATHTAVGTYREIDPPRRLVYTWDWEEQEMRVGDTLVTVLFSDRGGSTEIVLTHERFPNGEATAGHEQGWTSALNQFERLFA